MCGTSVTSREDFSGDDESGGVGACTKKKKETTCLVNDNFPRQTRANDRVHTEILEEVGQAVKEDESTLGVVEDGVVSEAHDDEDDGEHDESHQLNGFTTPLVKK